MWHPAYPRDSIRLNPLKNFSRTSEIAARVTALIPEDGDSFYRDIANTVLQYLVDAMMMVGEHVTLTKIRYYYEHFGLLIEKACIAWFESNKLDWKDALLGKVLATKDEETRAIICRSFQFPVGYKVRYHKGSAHPLISECSHYYGQHYASS